jgi:hypothetical protein
VNSPISEEILVCQMRIDQPPLQLRDPRLRPRAVE